MYLVQMIPSLNRYRYMGDSGLKTVTIPQDQDVKERDFFINFLFVSE